MIGKIYSSITPYYDRAQNRNSFKKRPVLVISGPRNNDYTVLPISTVSIQSNLDSEYDVKLDPTMYPQLNLNRISYVRTHKQTTVHKASLTTEISDFRNVYEDLYLTILEKLEKFNGEIMDSALR